MTARIGSMIALGFAFLWLRLGASALPMPWALIVGVAGICALLAVVWRVLRQSVVLGGGRGFDRRKFGVAVAFEVIAGLIAGWALGRTGLIAYAWPVIGIIVALHFIGLYWASPDPRYIALTLGMLAVNLIALVFPPGGAAMLAISGLGSATALAAATVRR